MATGNVVVTVVDVGQGQCTFVEIYDDTSPTPVLIHTLLFDCGSDKKSTGTKQNMQYIADKVAAMAAPAFDCVIFSHSDSDHISLMKTVLDDFPTTSPPNPPKVKLVWYGGNWDQYTKWKSKFNILDDLVKKDYCPKSEIKTPNSDYTGYDKKTKKYKECFWQSPDKFVTLYGIVSNVLSADPDWDKHKKVGQQKRGEPANRVSIICGLYYAGVSYVICGDATNKTMAAANKLLAGTTVFDNNIMTTLPHHGSRTTGYAVKSGAKASDNNKLTVTTFAALMKSKTISVSAYQTHSHPSLEVMVDFYPDGDPLLQDARLKQKNAHRVTSNIDLDLVLKSKTSGVPIVKIDHTCETDTNLFSTHYNLGTKTFSYKLKSGAEPAASEGVTATAGSFNNFACWKYITKSDGKFTVEGYTKLKTGLAAFTKAPAALMAQSKTAPAPPQLSGDGKNVFVRTKVAGTGKPVNIRPGFQSRLMQFR
ncbi:MAG: hypothetical protein WA584_12090 [Pyrinomonadaceae bacterium]